MTSHSVSAFQITVRNSAIRGKDKNAVLDDIAVKSKRYDLLAVINSFVQPLTKSYKTYLVNKTNKLIKIEGVKSKPGLRDLSFYVRQGSYGMPSEIISSKTLKPTHQKKPDESDVGAYFVQIRVPTGSKAGFAVLHYIGNVGVKNWLADHIGLFVNKTLPGCSFHLRPMATKIALKTYLKDAEVRSLKVSHYEPKESGDIANYLNDEKVEKTLTLKREGGFGKLSTFLNKNSSKRNQLVALSDEDLTDVKADVTFGGRTRVISLEGSKNPKAKFYLSEPEVTFSDGLPTPTSIAKYATALLDDLANEAAAGN